MVKKNKSKRRSKRMSATRRIIGYSKGKPVYGDEREAHYNWAGHESKEFRVEHSRKYRRKAKEAVRTGREIPRRDRTQGWGTW